MSLIGKMLIPAFLIAKFCDNHRLDRLTPVVRCSLEKVLRLRQRQPLLDSVFGQLGYVVYF
jgi:hypothetical protein